MLRLKKNLRSILILTLEKTTVVLVFSPKILCIKYYIKNVSLNASKGFCLLLVFPYTFFFKIQFYGRMETSTFQHSVVLFPHCACDVIVIVKYCKLV